MGALPIGLTGLVQRGGRTAGAAWRGSEAAMLAARQAPIGARICTARAIRTMGRKFRNRRRIKNHLFDVAN